MSRKSTTTRHVDDTTHLNPLPVVSLPVMPDFHNQLNEHTPVICQLLARKALSRPARPTTEPPLPASMRRLHELAVQEFEALRIGTLPNVRTLHDLLEARRCKRADAPGENGWDIMIRMLVTEEVSNYLGLLQPGSVSLDFPLLCAEVSSCNMFIAGIPPEEERGYAGCFNISVNERERAITLLTRMDRLRLTSARQRLKLLAAACFSCQLG